MGHSQIVGHSIYIYRTHTIGHNFNCSNICKMLNHWMFGYPFFFWIRPILRGAYRVSEDLKWMDNDDNMHTARNPNGDGRMGCSCFTRFFGSYRAPSVVFIDHNLCRMPNDLSEMGLESSPKKGGDDGECYFWAFHNPPNPAGFLPAHRIPCFSFSPDRRIVPVPVPPSAKFVKALFHDHLGKMKG